MRKLMSANLRRLWKDKYLWLTCAVCFLMCVIGTVDNCQAGGTMAFIGYTRTAEYYLYNGVPMLGAFLGAFVSLFLGTEHADGTIRNKVTVGKTRSTIYLSSFLTCFLGSLLLLLFWCLGSFLFLPMSGIPLEYGWSGVCLMLALIVGTQAVFSAIYTLIGNLCTNKAMTVVYSLVAFGTIMMVASGLYDRLCEQELITPAVVFVDGIPVPQEAAPNSLYLSGTVREVCQTFLELLPVGQLILISYVDVIHPARMLLFSLALTGIILLLGLFLFQKKDLK